MIRNYASLSLVTDLNRESRDRQTLSIEWIDWGKYDSDQLRLRYLLDGFGVKLQ